MGDIRQYRFYKENSGNWYIDLPEYLGNKSDLQMVCGADVMLDMLSKGGNEITLQISTSKQEFNIHFILDFKTLELESKCSQVTGGGAYYMWDDEKIWLCDVTKFVFGYFPKFIYFKVI